MKAVTRSSLQAEVPPALTPRLARLRDHLSSSDYACRRIGRELRRPGRRLDTCTSRALYSSDASLYRVVPQVVVRPRSTSMRCSRPSHACRATGTPLTSRGAGTSIAGNAVGTGIVIDFAATSTACYEIDVEARTARVDPGTVHAVLQRAARRSGLRFGPDPSTHTRCTVGGMIGNNACGSRALGYGRTADNVVGPRRRDRGGGAAAVGRGERRTRRRRSTELRDIVAGELATIRTEFGRFGRQVSGYSLEHLLPERGFDVATFMAGTEGTLAVDRRRPRSGSSRTRRTGDRRARLRRRWPTPPTPSRRSLPFGPDGLRGPRLAHRRRVPTPSGVGARRCRAGRAGCSSRSPATTAARLAATRGRRRRGVGRDRSPASSPTPVEQAVLWRIREEGAGPGDPHAADRHGARRVGGRRGAAGAARRPTCATSSALLADHERRRRAVRPLRRRLRPRAHRLPARRRRRAPQLFRDFVDRRRRRWSPRYGGSLSGEHGDGRARSELLPLMYSAEAIDLFEQVKGRLRPDDLLNPGVLVGPRPVDADLRGPGSRSGTARGPARPAPRCTTTATSARPSTAAPASASASPTATADGVMCPSFHGHPQREGLDPWPRPGAAGDDRRAPGHGRVSWRRRCTRRSTCACPARAAPATARPASTWRPTSPRCSTSRTAGGSGRAATTSSAGCRSGRG